MASSHQLVELRDINRLAAQLNSIAGIWHLFVGQLGVPRAIQHQISRKRASHPACPQICLVDGLHHWVWCDPSPTVVKVIAALSSKVINNKPLAMEISRQWGVKDAKGYVGDTPPRNGTDQHSRIEEIETHSPPPEMTLDEYKEMMAFKQFQNQKLAANQQQPNSESRRKQQPSVRNPGTEFAGGRRSESTVENTLSKGIDTEYDQEVDEAAACEEAAKEGFIRVRSRNILITGAGGAGKTAL